MAIVLINNILFFVKRDDVENAKGTVIITHGIAEHSLRYDEVTAFLNTSGFNVVRYDLRGHGQSQGARGKLKSFHQMIDDLHEMVKIEREKAPKKLFLLGHSMGGLIVNLYAVKYGDVDGIISSAAPTDYIKDVLPLRIVGYRFLGFIKKKTDFADGRLSRIKKVEEDYNNDPFVLKAFYISLVGNMFVSGVRYLNKHIKNYQTPVLILHGEEDKIVPVSFSKQLLENIAVEDKELIVYPGCYHEILNDLDREKVMGNIKDWLLGHTEGEA